MDRQDIIKLIKESNGKIISVSFIKRSMGEKRTMVCRLGVREYLTGEGPKYDFEEKGLICVFDLQKKQYRSIPIEGIISLKTMGEEYKIQKEI